jgi:hypothetical protein
MGKKEIKGQKRGKPLLVIESHQTRDYEDEKQVVEEIQVPYKEIKIRKYC